MFFVPSALLAFIPNPIISQNEAWFMSNTEKVHWLFHKLNEVIDRVNTYAELFNELKQILEEFDDTVKGAVEEYIHNMYDSGELGDIVRQAVSDNIDRIPFKSTSLDFSRLFRMLYNVGENNYYVQDTNQKTFLQAGCHFKHNDIYMCAVTLKCANHSVHRYDNTAKIIIYNMTNHNVLGSVNLVVGQANSLSYDSKTGYLYITWNTTNPQGTSASAPDKRISRIYVNDILDNKTTSFETRTVVTPNSYGAVATVSCYNGEVWLGYRNIIGKCNFVTIQGQDYAIINNAYILQNDDELKNITYVQDISINESYIALLTSMPSRLYLYDKNTKRLIWAYDIPHKLNDGIYRTLSVQSLTLEDNGNMYLFTGGHTCKRDFNSFDIMQVFKQNLYHNFIAPRHTDDENRQGRNTLIHYNHAYYVQHSNANPDGSSSNPFGIPSEAFMFIEDNDDIEEATLVVHSTYGGVPWYICCKKALYIELASDIDNWQTNLNVLIGGLAIEGCNNISFKGNEEGHQFKINSIGAHILTNDSGLDLRNNAIDIAHSTVYFSNVLVTIDEGSQDEFPRSSSVPSVDVGIRGRYCTLVYSGSSATTETSFENSYSGKDFVDLLHSIANMHGLASTNANILG